MAEARTYTIGSQRIKKGSMVGCCLEKERIMLTEGAHHGIFFPAINSFAQGSEWGILKMKSSLPNECIRVIRAFALDVEKIQISQMRDINAFLTDDTVGLNEKFAFFENADCIKAVNTDYMLLYELKGQYLWFCIEIIGEGNGWIDRMRLDNPGDNFMHTFPEIYQERASFFHRYMSIFSSIYGELQEEIEHVEQWIDPDTAPEQLLTMYVDWLGLKLEGEFVQGDMLRNLLKETYHLNSIKGTKKAVKRLIRLVLGENAEIIERNLLEEPAGREELVLYNHLYGNSKYDITILLNRESDEKLHAQMMYLLRQFVPIRGKIRLIFYKDCNQLDSYCFLDRNATLGQGTSGRINHSAALDSTLILE